MHRSAALGGSTSVEMYLDFCIEVFPLVEDSQHLHICRYRCMHA